MEIIKKLVFWKRFSRFFFLLFCLLIIGTAFYQGSKSVKADYACPAPVGAVSNMTPNGTTYDSGTRRVTLSWSPASQALAYFVVVRTLSDQVIFSDNNYASTSVSISNLSDGTSYRWSIRPKNNCEDGSLFQATFSIGSTTCSPVTCSDGTVVNPDTNNNCQYTCPNQPTVGGSLTCTILQNLVSGLQSNNSYRYQLTGNLNSSYSGSIIYDWDFSDNGSVDRPNAGQTIYQDFFSSTPVRLIITDSVNHSGSCTTQINLPNQSSNQCNVYTDQQTQCSGNQQCTYNVTHNSSYCGSESRNLAFCQYISGKCGYNPGTTGSTCTSISCPTITGCTWVGSVTSSCTAGTILTCGTLNCPNTTGTINFPAGGESIVISNNNTNNNNNNNNNNITIK